jgi:iron complex transport system substrate-binding protein
MAVKLTRLFQWFLLAGLVCLLAVACHRTASSSSPVTSEVSPSASTRLVEHALGETRIPTDPQRIVVLHDAILLEPLIALGIKPIAATTYAAADGLKFRGLTAEQTKNIEIVGDGHQPNLEKLLALSPDLILITDLNLHQVIYPQLTEIAPTVAIDWTQSHSFKDRLRFLANIFNKTDQASQILKQYQARVETFRQAMRQRVEEIQVSIIHAYGNPLTTPDSSHLISEVFSDAGLRRPVIQEEMAQKGETAFSLEVLPEHDADVLFIVKYPSSEVETILSNAIWKQLRAVQSGQVYEVNPERWASAGPISANQILDDLFKYLVDNPNLGAVS